MSRPNRKRETFGATSLILVSVVGLITLVPVTGCATRSSQSTRSSFASLEQTGSKHPWVDSVNGSPRVSDKQFDELPWWQQISARFSALFVRGVYDSAAHNSERESR
jgi:hypothetical protein